MKLQRVPRSARVLNFADSNKLRTGQTIYIVGNANGEGTCISMGILSDKLRPRRNDGKPHLLVDCAAFHGNSGGPVFDEALIKMTLITAQITQFRQIMPISC